MKNIVINSIVEVESFLQGNKGVDFEITSRKEKYEFISEILVHLKYLTLKKKDRSLVKKFLSLVTHYSKKQLKRLIKRWKKGGLIYSPKKSGGAIKTKYQPVDIALLIKTDIAHKTPNGNAVKKILEREFLVFKNKAYQTISQISVSHIYNIRKHKNQYLSSEAIKYSKTVPTQVNIGERKKPLPDGKTGYLRVDSVHQGDLDGIKGVYHINIVDEITQMEVVGCVENISYKFMIPLLEKMIGQFPFVIINFHSDNGSEYINQQVASMLEGLRINQTKSRPRHSNDNALAETKNGSILRKNIGRNHISKNNASAIEGWYEEYFNPYLCFHRICAFATDYIDKRGKIKKKYETYTSPYERLKSLPNAQQYLKPGISFEQLDKLAYAESDNDFAEKMKKAKKELFANFKK